jgi:hypothetical protein
MGSQVSFNLRSWAVSRVPWTSFPPPTWTRAEEDHPPNEIRKVECQLLRDHPAQRESYYVDGLQPQCLAELVASPGHLTVIEIDLM